MNPEFSSQPPPSRNRQLVAKSKSGPKHTGNPRVTLEHTREFGAHSDEKYAETKYPKAPQDKAKDLQSESSTPLTINRIGSEPKNDSLENLIILAFNKILYLFQYAYKLPKQAELYINRYEVIFSGKKKLVNAVRYMQFSKEAIMQLNQATKSQIESGANTCKEHILFIASLIKKNKGQELSWLTSLNDWHLLEFYQNNIEPLINAKEPPPTMDSNYRAQQQLIEQQQILIKQQQQYMQQLQKGKNSSRRQRRGVTNTPQGVSQSPIAAQLQADKQYREPSQPLLIPNPDRPLPQPQQTLPSAQQVFIQTPFLPQSAPRIPQTVSQHSQLPYFVWLSTDSSTNQPVCFIPLDTSQPVIDNTQYHKTKLHR